MKQASFDDPISGRVNDEKRGALLLEGPAAVGSSWARQYLEVMRRSGRRVEGGWPGTLPEARMRVLAALPQALQLQGLRPLDHREIVEAAAIAYAEARRNWQLAMKRRGRTARRETERSNKR